MRGRCSRCWKTRTSIPCRTSQPSTLSACGCCGRTAIRWCASAPVSRRRFSIYDDEDQLGIVKATYRAWAWTKKISCSTARRFPDQPRQEPEGDAAGFLQARRQPGNETLAKVFEEYEKRCTRPTRWISTTCCSKPSACSTTTRPRARRGTAAELPHDRRVPGHQPAAVRVDAPAIPTAPQRVRVGTKTSRSIAGAGRTSATFWISSAISPSPHHPAGAELPVHENHPAAAGAVVENNKARKGKKLWTEGAEGEHVGLYAAFDAENEALFIADTTKSIWRGIPAIAWRSSTAHMPSRGGSKRPCGATGASTTSWAASVFYQRAEIKDTVAYLKLAASNLIR